MGGVGDVLVVKLIAEIGDVRRLHNAKALTAWAGVDPPPYESGQFIGSKRKITKRGSSSLRKVGYEVIRVLKSHPAPKDVLQVIKGNDIELPVLLAAWLSFSMSEVRGLTKSKSVHGDYIIINEVVVDIHGKPYRKDMAKNSTRNRRYRISPYIKDLINRVDGDVLVPISGRTLYHRWIKLQDDNGMDHTVRKSR